MMSLLHVADFSTVAEFPTDTGSTAASVIPDVNGVLSVVASLPCILLLASLLLQAFAGEGGDELC